MKAGIISIVIAAGALTGIALITLSPPTAAAASVACAKVGAGEKVRRVLIVGESWASKGRLLPELPATIASRTKEQVVACSFGYSGKNSAKVAASVDTSAVTQRLGGAPHHVIILLGVNDQLQHRDADDFAENVASIGSKFPQARVHAVSAPAVSLHPPLAIQYRVKNAVADLLNDDERSDYNAALAHRLQKQQIIDFDQFSTGFPADRKRFAPDGIHLTTAVFHDYGRFIGNQMSVSPIN